jgi:hypothetical protein
MADRPKPLFSRSVKTSRSMIFLDVYEGRESPYLSLCESKKNKEGVYEKIRFFLNREGVTGLKVALRDVEDFLLSLDGRTHSAPEAPAGPPASPERESATPTPSGTSESPTSQPRASAGPTSSTTNGGTTKRAGW